MTEYSTPDNYVVCSTEFSSLAFRLFSRVADERYVMSNVLNYFWPVFFIYYVFLRRHKNFKIYYLKITFFAELEFRDWYFLTKRCYCLAQTFPLLMFWNTCLQCGKDDFENLLWKWHNLWCCCNRICVWAVTR